MTTSELIRSAMTPEVAKTYYAVRPVTWRPRQDPDEFVETVLQVLRCQPDDRGGRGAVAPAGCVNDGPRPASRARHPREREREEGQFGGECFRRLRRGVPAKVARRRRHRGLLRFLNIDSARKERVLTMAKVVADVPEPAQLPVLRELCRRRYEKKGAGMGPEHDDGHTERPESVAKPGGGPGRQPSSLARGSTQGAAGTTTNNRRERRCRSSRATWTSSPCIGSPRPWPSRPVGMQRVRGSWALRE